MNRDELVKSLEGVVASIKSESAKLTAMYSDMNATKEARDAQVKVVKDLEDRANYFENEIKKFDDEVNSKMSNQIPTTTPAPMAVDMIKAKAALIRSAISNSAMDKKYMDALEIDGGTHFTSGEKLLPSTLTTELLLEPFAKNPLRGISTFTTITNLEIPKVLYDLSDDSFLATDSDTAKEMKTEANLVQFERNKFKVYVAIPETVFYGTDTNLVSTVDMALESGLAKKEKAVAFGKQDSFSATGNPTSFYANTAVAASDADGATYCIKAFKGATKYESLMLAIADLEEDYADNARVVMRRQDYFAMIKDLINDNGQLFNMTPEQILGVPVTYCDYATIPVVGDFNYSHFNYDLKVMYDSDKDILTGNHRYVITAWIDHKVKMKSAFRLAILP